MIFRPELAAKVMTGDKTVTRRLAVDNLRSPWHRERCGYEVGRCYAVQPGRGQFAVGRVEILGVTIEPLGGVLTTAGEPKREGFDSMGAFLDAWVAINGSWDPNALVWRVSFRAVP